MKITVAIITNIVFILSYSIKTHPFEVETHTELSQRAVLSSTLDDFLKTQLNFPAGVQTSLHGDEIIDRISVGSVREDDGFRFLNHFHNPLRAWNQAGLLGSILGSSSIIWGQNQAQGFAWQNARDEYFLGLTGTTQDEREGHLANTFRALGQLIHLVQDAAQPAHTRNDPHPIFKGLEGYVENIRLSETALFNSWINSPPVAFDPNILTGSPNSLAPIPVARIIDTTDPEQSSAVPSAGTNQGLAEYSNANFLSEDTIFKDFTFPRVESLGPPEDSIEPVTGMPRRYFRKLFDGDTGYRLVAEGTWSEKLISVAAGDQGYILDRGVFEDYATKLLPRAIGYSAGLIDYFFRPRMFCIGFIDHLPSARSYDTIRNVSVSLFADGQPNETAGQGKLQIIGFLLNAQGQQIIPGQLISSPPVDVDLSNPPPAGYEIRIDNVPPDGAAYYCVFKGKLGDEDQSVASGFIFEP